MNQRKSKWLRAVCLSLAVVMALGCLTSCNKGGESSLPSSAPESSAPESEASGNEALDSDTQLAFPVGTEKPETVEEKTIGSIDKERQLKLFKETMDAELEWLASLQAPNGAIPQTLPDANRQARVITCFSAQTCMALLLEPEKYGENVRKYLDWYLSHLNTAETDVSGVDGTMYDYDLTFSADGKEVTEAPVVDDTTKEYHYDSTDAYAAITLKILWDYAEACDDRQYLLDHKSEIDRLANAIYATMDDGLTWATPKYFIKYVMDNFEVWRGLSSLSKIYQEVFIPAAGEDKDACEAEFKKHTKAANTVLKQIEEKLWNDEYGYYNVGLDKMGNVYMEFDPTINYPCAMAQVESIAMGIIHPDSPRAKKLYEGFNSYWSTGNAKTTWEKLDIGSLFVSANNALCGATMGDMERTETFMVYYNYRIQGGRLWPVYNADVAMVALACAKGIEYINSCTVVEQTEAEAFVPPDPAVVEGAPVLGGENDITKNGSIICSVMPSEVTGTGSKDIEIIRSGTWVNALSAVNTSQYDTFTGKRQKEGYVGIDFGEETYKFTSFAFQEGMHFGNGGWFAEQPKIQVKVNGEWVDVQNQKCGKDYPEGEGMGDFGDYFEIYPFTFDPIEGTAIRLYATPGGFPAFFSVGQIQVCGTK
ncbi:MAG TPA: hypothetical protein H9684_07710 [Firmicutes bacterium]|nr:hypothetical protein [Bacillota bacterium]